MRAVALLYHDVVTPGERDESGYQGAAADSYKMDPSLFRAHLEALAARVCSARHGARSHEPRAERTVLLTFDDGGRSAFDTTAPALEERGWIGHFLVTAGRLDTPAFLSTPQVRALADRGHVIGSHSLSHPMRMSQCTPEQLRDEWGRSVDVLQQAIGRPVDVASVPGGYYSVEVARAAAEAGIRVLFTSEPTTVVDAVDGCAILGRFLLRSGSTAAHAADLATGARMSRLRQWVAWNGKKAAKRLGGRSYLRLRHLYLPDPAHERALRDR